MNKDNTQNYWPIHVHLGYMALPFITNYRTFLKILIGTPIATFYDWLTWRLWRQKDPRNNDAAISTLELVIGVGELVIGVFFLVIGGFLYKYLYFPFRNVTIRDLIKFNWQVYYSGSVNSLDRLNTVLVYNNYYKLAEALVRTENKAHPFLLATRITTLPGSLDYNGYVTGY
jgi:hypothetical protein